MQPQHNTMWQFLHAIRCEFMYFVGSGFMLRCMRSTDDELREPTEAPLRCCSLDVCAQHGPSAMRLCGLRCLRSHPHITCL